jgi:hypothetical protein
MKHKVGMVMGFFVVLLLVTGCGGGGGGGDGNGDGSEPGTFTSLWENVFSIHCTGSGCHQPGGTGWLQTGGNNGGLDLSERDAAYESLVNVPSFQKPELDRVEPDAPESSYLIKKLRGDPDIVADRMPQQCPQLRPCLSEDQITEISDWILDEAPNN